MSERTARLDHLLREEISAIIAREIADPRVGFVTVTQVEVTPDLGHATVWVSAIGSPAERRASVRALGRAMPFVRHRLGTLRLKRIPQLHLREDDSASRGTRVMHILQELESGTVEPGDGPPDQLPTPGPVRSTPPVPPAPVARPPARTPAGARPPSRRGRPPARHGAAPTDRARGHRP